MISPIKSNLSTAYLMDPATGVLKELGEIKEVTFTPNENDEIRLSDDRVLISSEPVTIPFTIFNRDQLKAFFIFALTGNNLYLRFPKKLRRRRRK